MVAVHERRAEQGAPPEPRLCRKVSGNPTRHGPSNLMG